MILCLTTPYYFDPIPYFENLDPLIFIIPVVCLVITNLVLCAVIISSPIHEKGVISKRNGVRITILIFSFLVGQIITFALIIAVLFLKDYTKTNATDNIKEVSNTENQSEKTLKQLLEIKKWKEAGLITEEEYNIKRKQILQI